VNDAALAPFWGTSTLVLAGLGLLLLFLAIALGRWPVWLASYLVLLAALALALLAGRASAAAGRVEADLATAASQPDVESGVLHAITPAGAVAARPAEPSGRP
jgi:hypothetical protein